jgi:quercetin dioxygenase-like cupin family protein
VSAFDELAGLRPLRIWEGIHARIVEGERAAIAFVELDPGSVVAEHSHENEQLGFVIRGSLAFRIGSETRDVGPGDTWSIPANTPHEVTAGPEGAVVVDVFSPPRDDWHDLEREGPREPRWP